MAGPRQVRWCALGNGALGSGSASLKRMQRRRGGALAPLQNSIKPAETRGRAAGRPSRARPVQDRAGGEGDPQVVWGEARHLGAGARPRAVMPALSTSCPHLDLRYHDLEPVVPMAVRGLAPTPRRLTSPQTSCGSPSPHARSCTGRARDGRPAARPRVLAPFGDVWSEASAPPLRFRIRFKRVDPVLNAPLPAAYHLTCLVPPTPNLKP